MTVSREAKTKRRALQVIGVLVVACSVWIFFAYLYDEQNLAKQRAEDGPPRYTTEQAQSLLIQHVSSSEQGEAANLNWQSAATYPIFNPQCRSRSEYAFMIRVDSVLVAEVKRIDLNYCVDKFNGQVRAADSLSQALTSVIN
jgi:hypothetical protein